MIARERKVKRRKIQVLAALFVAVVITGCGTVSSDVTSTEYEQIDGLEDTISAQLELKDTEEETESMPKEEKREASGKENTEELRITKSASVYSKPQEDASAVGHVVTGDKVKVINGYENEKW